MTTLPVESLFRRSRNPGFGQREPVLLVTPPSLFLLDERVFMSLGILKVGAVLERAGHPVEHLDLSGISNYLDALDVHLAVTKARAVAVTTTTPQMPAAALVARRVRERLPGVRLIVGGPHPTLVHAAYKLEAKRGRFGRALAALTKMLQMFDVVVSGDGEASIFEALRRPLCTGKRDDCPAPLGDGVKCPASDVPGREGLPVLCQINADAWRERVVDADDPTNGMFMSNADYEESPWPARHLVDVSSYHYSIEEHRAGSLVAQLGCPFRCGFSLTGDSLISTERGFERLVDLIEGDGDLEQCVHGGQVRVHRVRGKIATAAGWRSGVEVVDEGTRPVFEVAVENGLKVRATEEHPFLVVDGEDLVWREVRDLKVGDYLVLKNPHREWPTEYAYLRAPVNLPAIPPGGFRRRAEHRTPTTLTPDVAWLAGFVVGDGCLPMDGRPAVHVCVTPPVRKKLKRVVRQAFNVKLAINRSNVTEKMDHGWIHSRLAYAFFTEVLGMRPGDKLHIPRPILESPRDVLEAFLRGLFDADAYASALGEYLVTASATLAREVANAILMLGDVPNVNHVVAKSGGYRAGYEHFRVGRLRNDRIPTEKALYCSLKSGKWHWRTPRDPKSFLGVRRRTLRESGLRHPLDVEGHHYVRVEAITPCLPERVYDLRVPEDHSFLADGLVSHNCGGRNTKMLRKIRMRSTANIVAEIEHLHREHGLTGFMLYDDELNVNREMVNLMNAIADLQERLGVEFRLRGFVKSELLTDEQAAAMRRAGFRWILCGFEAAHPRILENIQKQATRDDNTRVLEIGARHGLKVKALMSVGHPGESEETILAVRDWLLEVRPADFDCTVISTFPGTPYYDEAEPHSELKDVWTYVAKKSGDRLHSYDVDYSTTADYYKGDPDGGYKSYVFTDHLSAEEIVRLRDQVEREVREKLKIPFNPGAPGIRYEHSMGQGANELPGFVLRRSGTH